MMTSEDFSYQALTLRVSGMRVNVRSTVNVTHALEQVAVDHLHGRHHRARYDFSRDTVAGKIKTLERVGIGSRVAVAELTANAQRLRETLHHRDDLRDLRILRQDAQIRDGLNGDC